jgi:hypothetical protein
MTRKSSCSDPNGIPRWAKELAATSMREPAAAVPDLYEPLLRIYEVATCLGVSQRRDRNCEDWTFYSSVSQGAGAFSPRFYRRPRGYWVEGG